MPATLINLTGFTFAIASDETGINIEKITQKFTAKKIEVPNKGGETRGVVSYDKKQEINVSGETTGLTGLGAAACGVVITIANMIDGHGVTTGLVYTDDVTVEMTRETLQTLDLNATRYPLITS